VPRQRADPAGRGVVLNVTRGEAVKDYYQVLDIRPDASTEDIKRAFRQQIALYHPDKVQHLAREFQDWRACGLPS